MIKNLFDEALEIHKSGNLLKAEDKYRLILKQSPNHPETLHYYGLIFYQREDYKKAIDFFSKSILIDHFQHKAFLNRGNAYAFLKNYEKAFQDYDQALKLKPSFSLVNFNKGKLYLDLKKHEEAKEYFEKCLREDPKNPEALVNLGIVFSFLKNYTSAKEKYDKAISLKPDFPEAYSSRGLLYKEIGNSKLAINDFLVGLKLEKTFINCFNNLLSLLIQTEQLNLLEKNKINPDFLSKNDLLSSTYLTISKFIEGNFESSKVYLNHCHNILEKKGELDKLTEVNKDFVLGFLNFISSLMINSNFEKKENLPIINHIGESHCLSFAHKKITLQNKEYIILPKICFGVKAFHLGQKTKNIYKNIIKIHLNRTSPNSILFISIGEIDCRLNEGFFVAAKKNNLSIEKMVEDTVRKFVNFISSNIKNKQIRLFFINIPAPNFKINHSAKDKIKLITIIQKFNNTLYNYAKKKNFEIIDVYELTSNESGSSNKLYHCDDKHLGHNILGQIEEKLNSIL